MSARRRKTKTVRIPAPLFEQVKSRIAGSRFRSVSSYVTHVLRQIESQNMREETYSKEDEEKVARRLKALGYLD